MFGFSRLWDLRSVRFLDFQMCNWFWDFVYPQIFLSSSYLPVFPKVVELAGSSYVHMSSCFWYVPMFNSRRCSDSNIYQFFKYFIFLDCLMFGFSRLWDLRSVRFLDFQMFSWFWDFPYPQCVFFIIISSSVSKGCRTFRIFICSHVQLLLIRSNVQQAQMFGF